MGTTVVKSVHHRRVAPSPPTGYPPTYERKSDNQETVAMVTNSNERSHYFQSNNPDFLEFVMNEQMEQTGPRVHRQGNGLWIGSRDSSSHSLPTIHSRTDRAGVMRYFITTLLQVYR